MSNHWTVDRIPNQAGRTAIVTGANSGLGLETAIALARATARVILACRNPSKAQAALTRLHSEVEHADASLMTLDLANLSSVRQFATDVLAQHERLDLLINNAGVMAVPLSRTADGFEMQMGTNHLGHFALTGLLIARLQATQNSRIVNLSSMAHRWTRGIKFDDLNFERTKYNKWEAYGKSKLANLLFTLELRQRLQQSSANTIVAAAHPGYSSTNLQMVGPQVSGSKLSALAMKVGNSLMGQSAAMGALPSLYAATAADVKNGDYYGPDGFQQLGGYPRKVGCNRNAQDTRAAALLWERSEALTGVRFSQ